MIPKDELDRLAQFLWNEYPYEMQGDARGARETPVDVAIKLLKRKAGGAG